MAKFFKEEETKQTSTDSLELLEQESAQELDEIAQGFRERVQAENKRFMDVCDSEYYCCVCFASREQKEEFLKSLDIGEDERYIDGREIARKIGKALKSKDLEVRATRPIDKDWVKLARG